MLGVSRYTKTSNGYVKLYIPGRGVIEEHRYVMEHILGRRLAYNEIVHHKDGDKQNNAPENLELRERAGHAREHGRRPKIKLVCPQCGNSFERLASVVRSRRKAHKALYCSRSCVGKACGRGM